MDIEGIRPVVKGPYLVPGDIKDLDFVAVDLGKVNLMQMSEKGDVLVNLDENDIHLKLFHSDGKVETFQKSKPVVLLPSGKTGLDFSIYERFKTALVVNQATEDGVYYDSSFGALNRRSLGMHNEASGASYKVNLNESKRVEIKAATSKGYSYGTVETQGFLAEAFPKHEIAIIKDSQVTFVELPIGCIDPWLCASNDSLFLTSDSFRSEQNIWIYKSDRFESIDVVPNSGRQILLGVSSRGHMLIDIEKTPHPKGKGGFEPHYISSGKFYLVKSISENLGLQFLSIGGNFGPCSRRLDENGDFTIHALVKGENHLFLLKRIS